MFLVVNRIAIFYLQDIQTGDVIWKFPLVSFGRGGGGGCGKMRSIGGVVVSNAYQNRRYVFAKSQYQTIIGAIEDRCLVQRNVAKNTAIKNFFMARISENSGACSAQILSKVI